MQEVGFVLETRIISERQDLTYLSWSKIRNSSGTAGSFLKAGGIADNHNVYYKLSNFDSYRGITGHECVNEIIVDRLLTVLGVEHLHYQLINADILVGDKKYNTYLCASDDFKEAGDSKLALDIFYELERLEEENALDFCIRMGWGKYIYEMLAIDFIILNRDRHGANLEVLRNPKKKTMRIAPLFDHGISLVFNCGDEEKVKAFDVLEDRRVQSFIGTQSARDNLKLIPIDEQPKLKPLMESHRTVIMNGMDPILPALWQDKIWEMIWERWNYYEDFCNKR